MAVRAYMWTGILAAFCLAASPVVAQKAGKDKGAKKAKAKKGKAKKAKAKKGKAKKAGEEKPEAKDAKPADQPDPATLEDPKKKASAYYKLGKTKHEAKDYAPALEYFLKAYDALPNPAVYIPISDCYENTGNITEAVNYLEKYVDEKPDAGNIVAMKEKLAALKATPGKAKIVTDPPGATITVNGETIEMVTPAELDLPGGDHAVALSLDGHIMETRAFTVPLGGEVTLEVKLTSTAAKIEEPLPLPVEPVEIDFDEEEEKKPSKVGPGVWAMVGISGAGLVSATVFGLLALSEQASFDDNPTEGSQKKGNAFAIVCDVSWGVAAAAAITGTILYFVGNKKAAKETAAENDSPIESAAVYPIVTEDGAGVGASMSF